jgi:hypothetical protein
MQPHLPGSQQRRQQTACAPRPQRVGGTPCRLRCLHLQGQFHAHDCKQQRDDSIVSRAQAMRARCSGHTRLSTCSVDRSVLPCRCTHLLQRPCALCAEMRRAPLSRKQNIGSRRTSAYAPDGSWLPMRRACGRMRPPWSPICDRQHQHLLAPDTLLYPSRLQTQDAKLMTARLKVAFMCLHQAGG